MNVFAADVVESGTCGTNLTWSLDDEGVLTISGEGKMANYTEDSTAPWYSKRTQIKNVVIEDGVTSIGKYAFYNYKSSQSIIFNCTQDYALTNFDQYFLSNCSAHVTYTEAL